MVKSVGWCHYCLLLTTVLSPFHYSLPIAASFVVAPKHSSPQTIGSNMSAVPTTTMTAAHTSTTGSTTPTTKPQKTFYQRPLPASCTALSSKKGKRIFASALASNGLKSFFVLIQQFTTQSEPAYCGISTLVLVLNALSVDPGITWKGPWRWYEESMLNCCLDLEEVKQTGITLRDFQCLAHCQGLSVDLTYCNEQATVEEFRTAVQKACMDQVNDNDTDGEDENDDTVGGEGSTNMTPMDILVVSYCRKVLGQTGSGHFSPIAAYDPSSDLVLILDTARFKYGAHWAPLPLVFNAMRTTDPDTGKSRGYTLLTFPPPDQELSPLYTKKTTTTTAKCICDKNPGPTCNTTTPQPLSILFRSKMCQSPARSRYKDFLTSLRKRNANGTRAITWEQVVSYWSSQGSDFDRIWDILEPRRLPREEKGIETVKQLSALMKSLISTGDTVIFPTYCCKSEEEKSYMSTQNAVFVVYLASLDRKQREEIVWNSTASSAYSKWTKEQLLCEAELVAAAIEVSDQTTLGVQ